MPLQIQKRAQILSVQLSDCSWLFSGETERYQHPRSLLCVPLHRFPPPLKNNHYGSLHSEIEPCFREESIQFKTLLRGRKPKYYKISEEVGRCWQGWSRMALLVLGKVQNPKDISVVCRSVLLTLRVLVSPLSSLGRPHQLLLKTRHKTYT